LRRFTLREVSADAVRRPWSGVPTGTKLSFLQRNDEGEHGELWYVDAATGEKKVLVSATKLGLAGARL